MVAYVRGFNPDIVGMRLSVPDAPVASRAAELKEPVVIGDYFAEPPEFYVGFPKIQKLRATLAVPLFVREEVVGCLFAWMRDEPRVFDETEVAFARQVAATVAIALENARLYDAEKSARRLAEATQDLLNDELRRTRTLLHASRELTTAEGTDDLLERLGRILMDTTGISRVFINLVDVSRRVLIPKVASGGLVMPGGPEVEFERLSETSRIAIAESKTALLDYELPSTPEQDRAIAASNRSRLVLFVPLTHHSEIVGHIALDEPDERCEFSPERVELVESIASLAAVMLQNARLFEREHEIAETLQHAIISPPEQVDGLAISYLYKPAAPAANVGGDFSDLFALDERRVAMVVGDVSGKGIDAAQFTTLMRDGARAYLFETDDPSEVLGRLNTLAHRFTPLESFATVFLGVLDRETGEFVYCGAGHPAPVIVGREGARQLPTQPGLVGAFPDVAFRAATSTLARGETLVMFTDGLTEARNGGEMFGDMGVIEALDRHRDARVADLPDALLDDVLAYSRGRLRDDVIILCVQRLSEDGAAESQRFS